MVAENLFTWQRIERYPKSGGLFKSDNTVVNQAMGFDFFSHLHTAEYTPIVESKPLPIVSKLRNRMVPENGNFSVVDGEIEIDGTTELHSLYTRDYGIYLPGLIGIPGLGYRIPDTSTGHYEFGYGNGQGDRFGLECDNGQWYSFVESAGNRYYRKPREEWIDPLDGTGPSGLTIDLSRAVLRMPHGWYGYLNVEFRIAYEDREGGDSIVIADRSAGRDDGVTIRQPDLPIFVECNGGVMYVGGRQYGVYGRYKPQTRPVISPVVTQSVSDTDFTPILSYKVKTNTEWLSVPTYIDTATVVPEGGDIEYITMLVEESELVGADFGPVTESNPDESGVLIDTSATSINNLESGFKMGGDLAVVSQNGRAQAPDDLDSSRGTKVPVGYVVVLAARGLSGTATVNGILRLVQEF